MRKCTGNNTQDWGFDAIFDVKCPNCENLVEFFKDEINRKSSDIWFSGKKSKYFECRNRRYIWKPFF
jgi:phage FluMu protein Com